MDVERAYKVLKEVAKRNGTTVETVIKEIELGINEAIDTAIKENNIVVLNEWEKIPCVGSRPTAVELVVCLGERMFGDMTHDHYYIEEDLGSSNYCS